MVKSLGAPPWPRDHIPGFPPDASTVVGGAALAFLFLTSLEPTSLYCVAHGYHSERDLGIGLQPLVREQGTAMWLQGKSSLNTLVPSHPADPLTQSSLRAPSGQPVLALEHTVNEASSRPSNNAHRVSHHIKSAHCHSRQYNNPQNSRLPGPKARLREGAMAAGTGRQGSHIPRQPSLAPTHAPRVQLPCLAQLPLEAWPFLRSQPQ